MEKNENGSYNSPMKSFCFVLLIAVLSHSKSWYLALDDAERFEVEFLADPYYSATNVSGSLIDESLPKYELKGEASVYPYLLNNFLNYRFFLAEVSLNPLPLLGVYLRSEQPGFYKGAEVVEGLNLVQSLTIGFPDPGALSLFFGNIARFVNEKGEKSGKGFSGVLLSIGAHHIVDNRVINDVWVEVEAKLKGSDIRDRRELSWSFGLSTKEHFNPEVIDELKLSIKRQRTDKDYNGWSLFKNSELEWVVQLNRDKVWKFWEYWDKTAIRYFALYGKRFPINGGSYVLSFSLGVARDIESGYKGALAKSVEREWTFVFRPNVLF